MTKVSEERMLQSDCLQLTTSMMDEGKEYLKEKNSAKAENEQLALKQKHADMRHDAALQRLEQQVADETSRMRTSLYAKDDKQKRHDEVLSKIRHLENTLQAKSSHLQNSQADAQMWQERLERELAAKQQELPLIEEAAQQTLADDVAYSAMQYDAELRRLEENGEEELEACKRQLQLTEESAEQKRLQDLEEKKVALQEAHESALQRGQQRCSDTVERIRKQEQQCAETLAVDLSDAFSRFVALKEAKEQQRLQDLAEQSLELGANIGLREEQSQQELRERDQYHTKRYEVSQEKHEMAQEALSRQFDAESNKKQLTKESIEDTLWELRQAQDAAEARRERDRAYYDERVLAEENATANALHELKVQGAHMKEEQRQRDLAHFEQELAKEREEQRELERRLEARYQHMMATVKTECSEELQKLQPESPFAKRPTVVELLDQKNIDASQQRFRKAYEPLRQRLKKFSTTNGPLHGARVCLLAPVRTSFDRPSQDTCFRLVSEVAHVLEPHGVEMKDVAVLCSDGGGHEICQPTTGSWERFPSLSCNAYRGDPEERVGCEVRLYSRLSIHTLIDALETALQGEGGSNVREALIQAGAKYDGPFIVDVAWPWLCTEAVLATKFPQFKIQGQQLVQLMQSIRACTDKRRQALLELTRTEGNKEDGALSDMQALCNYESLVQIEGELVPEEKVHLSKEEKPQQEATDVEGLLSDAMKAQSKLKKILAPLTTWARADLNDSSAVPPDDPQRFFLCSQDRLTPNAELYDPGIKTKGYVSSRAAKLQMEYETHPPLQNLTNVSGLSVFFESASDLLKGLEHLMDRFHVVWVQNGFRHASGVGPCNVSVGLKQQVPQGHISEVQLCLSGMVHVEQTVQKMHSDAIWDIMQGCNVPPEDMDEVTNVVHRSMYLSDGQLIQQAVHEVERLQAEVEKVGVRSKEYRALEKEARKYANSLIQERVGCRDADQ